METKDSNKPLKKGKGGRPQKNKSEKRTHHIKVSFSDTEWAEISKIANQKYIDLDKRGTTAPYFRTLLLSQNKSNARINDEIITNIVYEINKIGVNINQIAHLSNIKIKKNPQNNILTELLSAYNELQKLNSIVQKKIVDL